MSDVRLGLPSASSMARTEACPGWLNLKGDVEREQGPFQDDGDALATEGTNIHKAYETGDASELEESPKQIAERLERLTDRAVAEWAAQFPDGATITQLREKRLFMRDNALRPLVSAQVDRAYIYGTEGLIVDAKTGFLEPTPSEGNWQIRTQAACLKAEYPQLTTIRAGFAWSRLSQKLDLSDYDEGVLSAIATSIAAIAWRARQADAVRHAGPGCFYCPVKGHCREAIMYGALVAQEYHGLNEVDVLNKVAKLTPASLALVWKKRKVVEKITDAISDRLKKLPDAELAALGIGRVEGKRRVTVIDNLKAFELIDAEIGESAKSFFKPDMTGLAKHFKAIKGFSNDKAAKEFLEQTLTPALSITRDAGFLKEK